MEDKITVPDIIEDVKQEMCDGYCKWPKEWDGDEDDMIEDICSECPLGRLG